MGPDTFFLHNFRLGLWTLIDLGFGYGVIDEVAVVMVLLNMVSSVSPYLNDV